MADNVTIPAVGTGTTTPSIATDDVGGQHFQKVKLAAGQADSATMIEGDANGLSTQGQVAADAPVAGKPVRVAGRASDAIPTAVSADGDTVDAWHGRRGDYVARLVDDSGDSVNDNTLNAVKVAVVTGSVSGTEYSEGSTQTAITGTAMLFEGTSDVVRVPSATNPLPVHVQSGSAAATQYDEGVTDASMTVMMAGWEDTGDTARAASVAKPFPVQVVTSPGGSVLPDPVVTSGAVAVPIKFANVNATADGDNTIVSGVASKKLRVLGYMLVLTAAGTVQFKSATTTIKGRLRAAADGGASYAGGVDAPAFETDTAEAIVFNNPAGVDVVGHLTYIEV